MRKTLLLPFLPCLSNVRIISGMLFVILICFSISNSSFAQCCLTNTLIINTGYNPMGAGAAVPGGAQAAAPVTDPHWQICYMDPGLLSDITASGLTPIVPTAQADVIQPAPGWATFPGGAGGPGNWINSFNGYNYIQTTTNNYSWIVSRSFTLYCDAQVTFNFPNITADNWILDGGIDGPGCDQTGTGYIPITGIVLTPYCCYGLSGGVGISVFGGNPGMFYTLAPFTVNLAAGVHTIYFRMLNDNTNNNNIAFAAQAYITTPSPSLVPENVVCTSPGICPATGPSLCPGATTTLSDGGIAAGTWSSNNTNVATVSATGIVSGVSPGSASITYSLPTGFGCPSITTIMVNTLGATSSRINDSVCAAAGSATLNAPGGYTSYLWSNGSTASSISVDSTGIYWVEGLGSSCGLLVDTFYTT